MNRIGNYIAGLAVSMTIALGLNSPAAAAGMDIVETAASAGSFNTLIAAAQAAGLVDALKSTGPITVFAPTDDAFNKLPEGTVAELLKPENASKLQAILKYHVVSGSVMSGDAMNLTSAPTLLGQEISIHSGSNGLTIDNAQVISADIKASNGVIHVIDSVLIPRDLVTVAVEAGSFNTLAAALKAAGLIDTLSNGGPFTVFAPTDAAFAKLPEGVVADLLKPENVDQLRAILTYHVVPGTWLAADVVTWHEAPTVNGTPAPINTGSAGVTIGGAEIVATDIQTLNGVIHVIDSVMIPDTGSKTAQTACQTGTSCGG